MFWFSPRHLGYRCFAVCVLWILAIDLKNARCDEHYFLNINETEDVDTSSIYADSINNQTSAYNLALLSDTNATADNESLTTTETTSVAPTTTPVSIIVPGKPVNLTVKALAAGEMTLSWATPVTSTIDVDEYKITVSDGLKEEDYFSTETTYDVKSLQHYKEYNFSVRAIANVTGNIVEGEEATVSGKTLPSEPGPCDSFHVVTFDGRSVAVTWKEPLVKNGPINGYILKWQENGNPNTTMKEFDNSRITSFEITGLTPYTNYIIEVSAFNLDEEDVRKKLIGNATSLQKKTHVEAPDRASSLKIARRTSSELNVTWGDPDKKNGPLDGFLLTFEREGGESENHTILGNEPRFKTFSRLKPFAEYTVHVRPFNLDTRNSSAKRLFGTSLAKTARTFTDEPGRCRSLDAASIESRSVVMNWTEPEEKNGPIDGFILNWWNDSDAKILSETFNDSSIRTYEIKPLTPYTNYTIEILAFNLAEDDGNVGNKLNGNVTVTQLRTGVEAPENCSLFEVTDVTSRSIVVKWAEPTVKNGPLDGYILEWNEDNNEAMLGKTISLNGNLSFEILDLKPFANYTIRISAFNFDEDHTQTIGPATTIYDKTYVDAPDACESLNWTTVESHSVSLEWAPPIVRNGPLDGFVLKWFKTTDSEELQEINLSSTTTTYLITDLKPYTEYSVELFGYNEADQVGGKMNKLNGTSKYLTATTDVYDPGPPFLKDATFDEDTKHVVLSWDEPELPNGPLDGYYVSYKPTQQLEGDPTPAFITQVVNGTTASFVALYWRIYVFRVYAFNINSRNITKRGYFSEDYFETPHGQPYPPRNVKINILSKKSLDVTWSPPVPQTGPTRYVLEVLEARGNIEGLCNAESVKWTSHKIIYIKTWNTSFEVVPDLSAYRCYRVKLTAVVELEDGDTLFWDSEFSDAKQTFDGIPALPGGHLEVLTKHVNTLELFIPDIMFENSCGKVIRFGIIAQQIQEVNKTGYHRLRGELEDEDKLYTWRDVHVSQSPNITTAKYRATPLEWNPTSNEDTDNFNCTDHKEGEKGKKCVLGAQSNCTEVHFCNGELQPGTSYRIYLRKYTSGGFADSQSLTTQTLTVELAENSGTGGVAAAVSVVTLLLVAAAVALIAYRKGYLPFHWPLKKSTPLHNIVTNTTSNVVVLSDFEDSRKRPIPVSEFHRVIRDLKSDAYLGFSNEFEKLKKLSSEYSKECGSVPENRTKNRWTNIIPFDHARVKLLPIEEDESSDYINASFIPGFHSTTEYIATQGPLPDTINDFWRMVWEYKVQTIVMVTQCTEKGRIKCEEYWPDSPEGEQFGDLFIKLDASSTLPLYTIRQFSIILGNKRLRVAQFHFTKWADMSNPETPDDLISFIRAVREHYNKKIHQTSIVVHCSAGVGRTGTYITVDRLMSEIEEKKSESIDVFGTILDLRSNRVSMVQTEDQYVYIHQCLNRIIDEIQTVTPNGIAAENYEVIYANM